jgi:tetratricopeptide (TPR) repeat protein
MAKRKKVTRKQLLKEPDEFLTFSAKTFNFVVKYKVQALGAIGGLILIVLAISGFSYYSHKQASQAVAQLQKSWKLYESLRNEKGPAEAYQTVGPEFDKILSDHGRQPGGKAARVIFANIAYNGGDADKAITLYKAALEDFEDPFYRGQILNGLGYAYEAKKDLEKSSEYFETTAAGNSEVLKGEALFNLGRLYGTLGNLEKSMDAYQKVISDYPDSLYADMARERIGLTAAKPFVSASPPE